VPAAREMPAIRDMIRRLVGFDTTSAKSNLALIEDVADYLDRHGIVARLIHDESGTKANLYATLGPEGAGGIVLSGHTDVVPTEGQNWRADPYLAVERDGKLYGRGTADMKSFIATALALVPEMAARRLKIPIHLAFSYDEEVGCLGVRHLIAELGRDLPRPRLVIVGEPTGMRVVNAHKGITLVATRVVGRDAHSSAPALGASAIASAAELILHLTGIAADYARRPPRQGSIDAEFDPPCTTINVGTIAGGTALNIIPKECTFNWECRPLPESKDDEEIVARLDAFAAREVAPRLKKAGPEAGVFTHIKVAVPPLAPLPGSPAEALAMTLSGENRAHSVAYTSEAGLFQNAGFPAILCGPGHVEQAHQPDEFVAFDQLDSCATFLKKLIDHCAA
jgi:acetylornithine deacetylase